MRPRFICKGTSFYHTALSSDSSRFKVINFYKKNSMFYHVIKLHVLLKMCIVRFFQSSYQYQKFLIRENYYYDRVTCNNMYPGIIFLRFSCFLMMFIYSRIIWPWHKDNFLMKVCYHRNIVVYTDPCIFMFVSWHSSTLHDICFLKIV